MNYIVLDDNVEFAIQKFQIFSPTSEPLLYECVQNPDVQVGLVTILAFPDYFSPALNLECTVKMQALADRINGAAWSPAEGDYFTDIDNALRLYLITDITAPSIDFITVSGGELGDGTASESGFTDTRVPIIFDESGSGSGS